MAANIKAIGLHRLENVWWGTPNDVAAFGQIGLNERPSAVAKRIGIYDVDTAQKPLGYMARGQFVPNGSYQLVHENVPWGNTGYEVLPRAVSRYEPLQNKTLFEMTDALADYLQLEGIGMVGYNGEITFVQFRTETYDVGGHPNEQHQGWFLIGDDKTQGAPDIGNVSTRVVCNNTFKMAVRDLDPFPHTTDTAIYLGYAVYAYQKSLEQATEEREFLNRLFVTPFNDFNHAAQSIFPTPKIGKNLSNLGRFLGFDPKKAVEGSDFEIGDDEETRAIVAQELNRYRMELDRVEDRRSALADEFFAFNDMYGYAANTAYALFNATTALTSHGESRTKANGRPLFHQDSGVGMMWGERNTINARMYDYLSR